MSEEHAIQAEPEPDQADQPGPDRQPAEPPATAGSGRTGDAAVDNTLSTLDRLDELSIEEHLPLFEQAHEALRRALNRPPEAAGSGS